MNSGVRSQVSRPARRLRLVAAMVALLGGAIAFLPLPYPTSQPEREYALRIALDALLHGTAVTTPDGPEELMERGFATRAPDRLYFENEIGISDTAFLESGLKPFVRGRVIDFERGDVVVRASFRSLDGAPSRHMHFTYVCGNLGSHDYEIRIYKSLIQKRVVFVWMGGA